MPASARSFEIRLSASAARALSLFVYAALGLGNLGVGVGDAEPRHVAIAIGLLKIGGLLGAVALFLSGYGQLTQKAEHELDEREVAIRNRAYVLTHQIMIAVLFLGFFWVTLADRLGWWLPGAAQTADLITAFGLGSMALPAAILAWRDRPLPEE